MTGEVTLTGQVLPVGGIKEKVLAARAAGITRVFLPDRNEADVDEIRGEDLLTGLQFTYVDHVGAVLDKILAPPGSRRAGAGRGERRRGKPTARRAGRRRRVARTHAGEMATAGRGGRDGAYAELEHPADLFLEIRGRDLPDAVRERALRPLRPGRASSRGSRPGAS